MKRYFLRVNTILILLLLCCFATAIAQSSGYKTPDQVEQWVKNIVSANTGAVKAMDLSQTPGGRTVHLIEIGNEIASEIKSNPSIFVGANFEGSRPLATEGAISLTELILSNPAHYDSLNWYIIPLGNPDAASGYFKNPLQEISVNDLPTNDDRDDQTDEDGPDDLNGDGWITRMRLNHPDGEWMISEVDSRLMRKADPKKGEQGIYKIYSEGIDDDGDGKYNEDGAGGTNVGINFPHEFKSFTADGGIYPGSAPESYATMKFVFEHPDIAMIFSFGSTNFCYTPPVGGKKGEADLNRIKPSARQASQFGLDPAKTYTLKELADFFKAEHPEWNVDESSIPGIFRLGAALNPQAGDLIFYKKYASAYKKYLQKQGVTKERLDPQKAKDGSFEQWGYYHVGVPVFSMDLAWIDKPVKKKVAPRDTVKSINPAKSIAVEKKTEDKILEQEQALLAYSDSLLGKKGFVEWTPFVHPTLGQVEIGGFVPYMATTPPFDRADSMVKKQIPWILKLTGELPDLHIYKTKVTSRSAGIYQVEVWVENSAFIPFPTDMGSRNKQPAPAILTLEGDQVEFLAGYKRTPIQRVAGKSRVKRTLIISMEKPGKVTLKLESNTAGNDQTTISIGG